MIQIISEQFEKGKQFESLLKMVLSKQGYGSIESNIHSTGTEIDIEAKDNVSGSKIRLEAKAHSEPLDTPELKKFVLTASNDIKLGKIDYAVFWSLSGINSTARYYFENELSSELKNHITIKGDVEFQQILVETGIIGNESSINNNIVGLVKKNLLQRDLIYYKNQWYFIQYCSQKHEPTHFFILDNFGKPTDDILSKEIRIMYEKLKQLELILLDTKNRVLEFLLQHDSSSIDEIVEGIKETKIDIQSTIDELLEQRIIIEDKTDVVKYSANKEMDSFLIICREFLKNKKMILMRSAYFSNSMNMQIVEYIKNRWSLKLSKEQKKLILKMCLVSPSALGHALFGSTKAIQNQLEQFNQQIPPYMQKINQSAFMTELVISVLSDIQNHQSLGLQHTRGVRVDINLKMATEDELFFKIHTTTPLVTMKLKGSIKEGQGVVGTNPETYLETSSIFYSLGEIKTAIKEIDTALKNFKHEGEWVKVAYINKGMYLLEIGKLNDAEELLLKSTNLFPSQKEGWLNLGILFLAKNQIDDAKSCFMKSLDLDSGYAHAKYGLSRVAILEGDEDLCLKLLEELFLQEKRFVTRIQLEKEFKNLRKTKRYSELLKKLNLPKRI